MGEFDILDGLGVPIISAVVYFLMNFLKVRLYIDNPTKKAVFMKSIPSYSALIGAVLGIICFYLASDIIPVDNVIWAAIIGGVSGSAATGVFESFKNKIKAPKKVEPETEEPKE